MAACVENAMQDLALDAVDASAAPETAKAVVPEQPGTPDAAQKTSEEPNGTADKAKKQRRRRGKKPAAAANKIADENAAPADGEPSAAPADGKESAAPVDVAAILKARAAAKKGGRKGKPASAAAQAALANAKARPQKKSGAKGGRSEGEASGSDEPSKEYKAKTWVHSIFEGVTTTETRCCNCDTVTSRDEAFLDLSIEIEQDSQSKDGTSVQACLDAFTNEEDLKDEGKEGGDNRFFCDRCKSLQLSLIHI